MIKQTLDLVSFYLQHVCFFSCKKYLYLMIVSNTFVVNFLNKRIWPRILFVFMCFVYIFIFRCRNSKILKTPLIFRIFIFHFNLCVSLNHLLLSKVNDSWKNTFKIFHVVIKQSHKILNIMFLFKIQFYIFFYSISVNKQTVKSLLLSRKNILTWIFNDINS